MKTRLAFGVACIWLACLWTGVMIGQAFPRQRQPQPLPEIVPPAEPVAVAPAEQGQGQVQDILDLFTFLNNQPDPAPHARATPLVGSHVRLSGGSAVWLAAGTGRENWHALLDWQNSGSITGVSDLVSRGMIFRVEPNTEATVVSAGLGWFGVKISGGNESGRVGSVQSEFVKSANQ